MHTHRYYIQYICTYIDRCIHVHSSDHNNVHRGNTRPLVEANMILSLQSVSMTSGYLWVLKVGIPIESLVEAAFTDL